MSFAFVGKIEYVANLFLRFVDHTEDVLMGNVPRREMKNGFQKNQTFGFDMA